MYTFGAGGHSVHHVVDATFTLADGKILTHVDHFDFARWSTMALGLKGRLFGRTAWMRALIRR